MSTGVIFTSRANPLMRPKEPPLSHDINANATRPGTRYARGEPALKCPTVSGPSKPANLIATGRARTLRALEARRLRKHESGTSKVREARRQDGLRR
jgi:hypothetical protein